MPVYRADGESLLLHNDACCRVGCIAAALLDPQQPRRQIGREEQAGERYAATGCGLRNFRSLRLLQIHGIEHDRTTLSEDTLRGAH